MTRRLLLPSLSDCLFVSLLVWLFVVGEGWLGLLADGDTGWHIRAGEYILDHGSVPRRDLFSFSKPGAPWYAWEWLSDVLLALLHRGWGLKGVVLLAGAAIALSTPIVFRHALDCGASAFVALGVCLVGAGASSIHYLARPHIFTLLLLAVALWLAGRDRRRPSPAVWLLVPLAALWTNLHGGFPALPVSLALQALGAAVEAWREAPAARRWTAAWRLTALAAGTAAASLLNPYGTALHRHILGYLRSNWILEAVEEYQSPKFRSETAYQFELLLVAGLLLAGRLLWRRRVGEALLLLFWGHEALASVRHVPVFVVVAAPIVAAELTDLGKQWIARQPPRSWAAVLAALDRDFSAGFLRTSLWAPLVLAALLLADVRWKWPRDFPEAKFPVAMIGRNAARLRGARVFTSDQWADYLIYRFYPEQRVFIDGRSDFYGPEVGTQYLRLAYAHPEWRTVLERYGFEAALLPVTWPAAALLKREPGWRVVEDDGRAILLERRRPPPR